MEAEDIEREKERRKYGEVKRGRKGDSKGIKEGEEMKRGKGKKGDSE